MDLEIDEQSIAEAIIAHKARFDLAMAAGGISREEVVDGVKTVPVGYWFDIATRCYLPPGFQFGGDTLQ